jgi:ssDNA-binding Zn-finger/Zn-ribbon topoisomerase 1
MSLSIHTLKCGYELLIFFLKKTAIFSCSITSICGYDRRPEIPFAISCEDCEAVNVRLPQLINQTSVGH